MDFPSFADRPVTHARMEIPFTDKFGEYCLHRLPCIDGLAFLGIIGVYLSMKLKRKYFKNPSTSFRVTVRLSEVEVCFCLETLNFEL